jgi:hypothetical protein
MLRRPIVTAGLLLAVFFCRQPGLPGQGASDLEIDALDRRVKQFFGSLSSDDTQAAFQQLLAGSQVAKQTEAVKALVDKTRELKAKYGEVRNFEQVAAKRIGKDVVILRYLYQCEHFPIAWHVIFYRTPPRGEIPEEEEGSTWRVIVLRFDTDLEALAR